MQGLAPLTDLAAFSHRYCARLIQAWGGRLGTLNGTAAGQQFLQDLDKICIDDVRTLINHLIEKGYDKKIPERRSEQDILVVQETSPELVLLTERIRVELLAGSVTTERMTAELTSLLHEFRSRLQPHLIIYFSGRNSQRESSLTNCDAILEALELGVNREDSFLEDHCFAIDSDEEAQLYDELDDLLEAQERAVSFRGNTNKFIASSFQKLFLRIQELEDSFKLVSSNFPLNSDCV